MCNARRILLRREARDESSARNSVTCQSLETLALRYAVTLQECRISGFGFQLNSVQYAQKLPWNGVELAFF
jgi:hypothetical protein